MDIHQTPFLLLRLQIPLINQKQTLFMKVGNEVNKLLFAGAIPKDCQEKTNNNKRPAKSLGGCQRQVRTHQRYFS